MMGGACQWREDDAGGGRSSPKQSDSDNDTQKQLEAYASYGAHTTHAPLVGSLTVND